MRLVKEILPVPACVIGLALLGGALSLVTLMGCEDVGLVRYKSIQDSMQAWIGTLLFSATVGGLIGFVWSAKRCSLWLCPVLEVNDEVW